jgi:hypothetical protein
MNDLDNITGFNSKDVELKISKRMTSTYAYNQMEWDSPYSNNRVFVNGKMVYAEALLNCGASAKQIKEIIKHEYSHAWADYGQKESSGHKGIRFIERCKKLNCYSSSTNYDETLEKLFNTYIQNKIKKNKKIIDYKKIFCNLFSEVKYLNENDIRVMTTLIFKRGIQLTVSITEKYNEKELQYLFDNTIKEIKNILENNKDIQFDNDIKITNRNEYRQAIINYCHFNINN